MPHGRRHENMQTPLNPLDNELKEATERAELGWSADNARNTLAEAMLTIRAATSIARRAVTDMETLSSNVEQDFIRLRSIASSSPTSNSQKSPHLSRKQAGMLVNVCNRLLKALDVKELVKMSLDLTNQARIFVEMREKIDKRYGEEERQRAEDITRYLTAEQLVWVLGLIEENKEAGIVNV